MGQFTEMQEQWQENMEKYLFLSLSLSLSLFAILNLKYLLKSQVVLKTLPATAGDIRDEAGSLDWEEPWSRRWQPTPVLLTRESHGQRRLAGYSPWDPKESDMTELLSTHTH